MIFNKYAYLNTHIIDMEDDDESATVSAEDQRENEFQVRVVMPYPSHLTPLLV